MNRAGIVAVAALVVGACSPRVPGADPFLGVWRSDGYGLVLHVHDAVVDIHEIAGEHCILTSSEGARGIDDRLALDAGRVVLRDLDRVVWFDPIDALPAACAAPSTEVAAMAEATLRDHYHGETPADLEVGPGPDLEAVVRALLEPFDNPQVALVVDGVTWTPRSDPARLALRDAMTSGAYPEGAEVGGDGGIVFADLGGGLHYLGLVRLAGFAGSSVDSQVVLATAVDRAITGAGGLVIDLRAATAGAEAEALLVATRFVSTVTTVGSKEARRPDGSWAAAGDLVVHPRPQGNFAGPVVILVGPATAGPAEALVLALRDLPGVTVVGEPTAGSPGTPLARTLPNGWVLGVPNLDVVTPDGMRWAGRPIPPDVVVPLDATAVASGSDPALDAAREILVG